MHSPVLSFWRRGAACITGPKTRAWLCVAALALGQGSALAGGPKYVAGTSFFNPAVLGQPVRWAGGQVNYYVDQGSLNASVSNADATAMVDAAAALWSAVPTAGVTLTDKGFLNEDVDGANVTATANLTFSAPADVTPTATGYPVGVIYDADGSVINALLGTGASDPTSCQNNGVYVWIDYMNTDATFGHGIIVLNGLCATTANRLTMMQFELERAFGRILGLDFSQVNPLAMTDGDVAGFAGWPIMQPLSGACGEAGGNCLPGGLSLRYDDVAALNRIYPINAGNLASFPGKVSTAANTVSIQGTISFREGMGMQGVNVTARPLDANGNPMDEYAVTFVSGGYFNGDHGNPVSGWTDASGNLLSKWGSNNTAMQGYFDLSFMPLPPRMSSANYQVTFEEVNPLFIEENSVGPYVQGSPEPSGTMPVMAVPALSAGMTQTVTAKVANSAAGGYQEAIATEASPRLLPADGMWSGRLGQVGQTDWFEFPVRGNRVFTVVTLALDESGQPSDVKAMPSLGVWDGFAAVGSAAPGSEAGLNGATGESWLQVTAAGDDIVRLGIADLRGDGRPDYAYNGWVLYADTISPPRLPAAGGPIVIHGMGFRVVDTVLVGGKAAQVTSVSPNEITAIAPPAANGTTGSVDVEVDDAPAYFAEAIITGGVSYDAATGDALTLVTAPTSTVPVGVPMAFTVRALGADMTAAGGVTVTYTVTAGTAMLGCGQVSCAATTTGDGSATMNVTAADGTASIVIAALNNGSNVQAHFSGGTAPVLAALTPALSLAAGAIISWPTQALVLNSGLPMGGQSVIWQAATGITAPGTAAISNATGIAKATLTVGPLSEGQQTVSTACVNGTAQCVSFTAFGARAEYASLVAVAGTNQSMAVGATPGQITLRVLDMDGVAMAGGTVTLYQALYAWAPACPPHGRCAEVELLGVQTSTATSGLDGTVNFTAASIPGVATNLIGLAATGDTATLGIAIEQHP